MKTSLQQSTVLRQDLRMNTRLYQAMDLLYMPLLDLQQHLKTELETNPFLEMQEPDEEEAGPEVKSEKQESNENDEQAEADWEKIILDGFQVGASRGEFEESEFSERVRVQTTGLDDYLRDQLQMLDLTDRQRLLAEEFIGNIGEDGYLHATLEEIIEGGNKAIEAHRPDTESDEA